MNIYRFIQSKSIREYLEKVNHTFSSLEMAYIIWQCPDATLSERLDAWQEIIDTMPDDPLPDSMKLEEIEGVHEFLRQYMEIQQEFLDEINKKEDGVYFFKYTVRERPNETWPWEYIPMENFEHAFLSLSPIRNKVSFENSGSPIEIKAVVNEESALATEFLYAAGSEKVEEFWSSTFFASGKYLLDIL